MYLTAKVSEEVNRKLCAKNTAVQLLALYTDPECHNTQPYRRTDGRTDRQTDRQTTIMAPIADHTV